MEHPLHNYNFLKKKKRKKVTRKLAFKPWIFRAEIVHENETLKSI